MTLPPETLTFLFTDIEGSTRRWEQFPEAMRAALARHDRLLHQAVEQNGGRVFKTVGDGICAVFRSVPAAVCAVMQAHRALDQEHWEHMGPLRVRAGIHCGEAEERDGDYFGPTLNRVGRLQAIAYGGQTLLSQVAADAAGDVLPDGASLLDLGSHRLKDLSQPERVWQLCLPDLPAEFPPPRSLQSFANNLPLQMSSFVGRGHEMGKVQELLGRERLVTLTGAGGVGKTRLALQVAVDRLEEYGDGVWLVELAALSDSVLVPQAAASALGVREEPGRALTETLVDYLRARKALLLLDNCEHLIGACASLAQSLLRACPGVQVLATSREALNVPGERPWRVPPLSQPDPERLPREEKDLGAVLLEYDAVRLFVDRARVQTSDFMLSRASAGAVASICHRLDGIPLALELAAARVRAMPVEQVAARLDDRFRLLTGGSRTALPRQQTLRALMDWSYDLLSEPEKVLLRRLSVFAGGWPLEAAETTCAGDGIEDWEVLDLLTGLADKSLVNYVGDAEDEGEARYRLLETVRQYARDRLTESGAVLAYGSRHRDYFLALAEEAKEKLKGPEQGLWFARLEAEHDNLRAALDFCREDPAGAQAGLRMGAALQQFWWTRGHLSEGRERLAALLTRPGAQEPTEARAGALNGAGALAFMQGDYPGARGLFEQSLALRRELGDRRGVAATLGNLGVLTKNMGDLAAARSLHEEGLSVWRELGDRQGIANSLNNLGNVVIEQGDYAAARSLFEESLALRRELGDRRGVAASVGSLGSVAYHQGDYAAARALYEESLVLGRELGDKAGVAAALSNLGSVAHEQGDDSAARSLYTQSLALERELGDSRGVAVSLINLGPLLAGRGDFAGARDCLAEALTLCREHGYEREVPVALEAFAALARRQGQPGRAAGLYGAARALREALGSPAPRSAQEEQDRHQRELEAALGEGSYQAAFQAGRAMTQEQAVAFALGESVSVP